MNYFDILTPEDLSITMRERREALGLTQAELAERAHVSRKWLIDAERGKSRLELGSILRTLSCLGLALRPREVNVP